MSNMAVLFVVSILSSCIQCCLLLVSWCCEAC